MYGLVLLPNPPDPPTSPTIRAAFDKPLDAVFREIAMETAASSISAKIDIVIPCFKHQCFSRASHFEKLCRVLAKLYSLVKLIFRRIDLSSEGPRAVDARVLPLVWDAGHQYTSSTESAQRHLDCLVDLPALIESQRPWTKLFIVDGEKGYRLYQQFRELAVYRSGEGPIQRLSSAPKTVPGGIVFHNPSSSQSAGREIRNEAHYQVMTVDTFSHFEFDQKLLLTMATFLIEPPRPKRDLADSSTDSKLLVGIIDNPTASTNASAQNVQPYEIRQAAVAGFIDAVSNFRPPGSELAASTAGAGIGRSRDALMTIDYERITVMGDAAANSKHLSAAVLPAAGYVTSDRTVDEARIGKGWTPLESFHVVEVRTANSDDDEADP